MRRKKSVYRFEIAAGIPVRSSIRQCPSSSSAPELSAGIIAAIVISAITAAVAMALLIWWKCRSGNHITEYGAVEPEVEMQPTTEHQPEDNNTVEAHALPQGEPLMTLDQASPYPAAAAIVVVRSAQQTVVVSSDEIVITPTSTGSMEVV
eukprot:gene35293-45701_t